MIMGRSAYKVFVLLLVTSAVNCANILFFLGITTYSHRISVWPLVLKLAERGHHVTFLSAHPPKSLANANVTEVVPQAFVEMTKKFENSNMLEKRFEGEDGSGIWTAFMEFTMEGYELLGKDKEFLKWYASTNFDLVITDALYGELGFGLAFKSNAQYAVICTTNPYMFMGDDYGMPVESSWIPDMVIHYEEEEDMTLVQRIFNALKPIYWHYLRHFYFFPRVERVLREDLGLKDLPGLADMHKNVSLVLTNSHFAEEYGRALPPLVVPVGGMHCFQSKEVAPKNLQTFMDGTGSTGFIYVSFGSAARLSLLPPDVQEMFFTAMTNSPTNFLLKWNGELPENLPRNIFTASWLPQQSVLAHPNIKGFITHGGLLGIQESICSGVPLIVMPIFGEQDYNANRIHRRRRGIKMDLYGLSTEKLTKAISAILNDPTYKKNMKEASRLFLDRPTGAQDAAVWWTEYILRNGRVDFMKPLAVHQPWYKRRLLDVWLTLLLLLISIMMITLVLLQQLVRDSRSKTTVVSTKKLN